MPADLEWAKRIIYLKMPSCTFGAESFPTIPTLIIHMTRSGVLARINFVIKHLKLTDCDLKQIHAVFI
ncbi:MAG: hypothetical protein ACK56I_17035, partial [bacterium]